MQLKIREFFYFHIIIIFFIFLPSGMSQEDITVPELYSHVQVLTQKKWKGRAPGGKINKKIIRYIRKDLKDAGVKAFGKNYFQEFRTHIRVLEGESPVTGVQTWNVVGYIPGQNPEKSKEYIILGAHYDHLGSGGPSSKAESKTGLHYGADDNASGTAALLEIAEKLSANKALLDRSIIIVAFGAEEQGLVGSRHFVQNLPVKSEQIKLMINMDMVGRLNNERHIYMGGAGTFPGGMELMQTLGKSMNLTPIVHAGEVGGSDHVSFYEKGYSVLGLHTGGHPQYHTPEDQIDLINFPGMQTVAEYIYSAILKLANKDYELYFIRQD